MEISKFMRNGQTEEAIAVVDEIIESSKSETTVAQMKMVRMQILMLTGSDKAAKALEQFAAESDNAQMLNELAWRIFEQIESGEDVAEDLQKAAVQAAEKAVELAPDDGMILDTLAHLVYKQGDLDRALKLQTKAADRIQSQDVPEQTVEDIQNFLKTLQKEQKDK
jgi:tetratricopeptide (TPR) repeat protein